jgi:hypothetical protein
MTAITVARRETSPAAGWPASRLPARRTPLRNARTGRHAMGACYRRACRCHPNGHVRATVRPGSARVSGLFLLERDSRDINQSHRAGRRVIKKDLFTPRKHSVNREFCRSPTKRFTGRGRVKRRSERPSHSHHVADGRKPTNAAAIEDLAGAAGTVGGNARKPARQGFHDHIAKSLPPCSMSKH